MITATNTADNKYGMVTNTGKLTKMAMLKAITTEKKNAVNSAAKIISRRFLILPTKTKATAKASNKATSKVTTKKDTHA